MDSTTTTPTLQHQQQEQQYSRRRINWKQILSRVYQNHHSSNLRSKFLSCFLIACLTFQRVSLISPPSLSNHITFDSLTTNILNIFNYWRIYPIFSSSDDAYLYISYIFLAFNCIFLVNLFAMLVFELLKLTKYSTNHTIKWINLYLSQTNSAVLAVHNYMFLIPSISVSLEVRDTHQSIGNLTLASTLIVGAVVSIFDFSIEFVQKDFLSRNPSSWGILQLIRDSVLCVISQQDNDSLLLIFGFVFTAHQLLDFFIAQPFSDYQIKKSFLTSAMVTLVATIEAGVFVYAEIYQCWFLAFAVSLPFTWVLADKIFEEYCLRRFYYKVHLIELLGNNADSRGTTGSNVNSEEINSFSESISRISARKQISPDEFAFIVHFLHDDKHAYESYINSELGKGIIAEAVVLNHQVQCFDQKCFCYGIQSHQQQQVSGKWSDDDYLGESYRKEYMNKLILHLFKKFLAFSKDAKSLAIRILYISFIVDVYKAPTKCFTEMLECYERIDEYGWREYALTEKVKLDIEEYFKTMLLSTGFANQRMDMLMCVQFDDVLASIEETIRRLAPMYHEYLTQLFSDLIDLSELEKRGIQFIRMRQKIEEMIQSGYILNGTSKQLQYLVNVFSDHFDFKERSYKDFAKLTFTQRKRQADLKIPSMLFSEETCVVFMTVCNPIGVFRKVSNNFPSLVDQEHADIIGKSINHWLPGNVAMNHDAILRIFVETGSWNYISKSSSQLFFVNRRKFLVPVDVTFKLDYLQTEEDFGVTGYVMKRTEQMHYMTFHKASGKLSDVTEKLFFSFFSQKMMINLGTMNYTIIQVLFLSFDSNNLDSIRKIDLYKLMPMLGVFQVFEAMKESASSSTSSSSTIAKINEKLHRQGIEWRMHIIFPKNNLISKIQFFKSSYSVTAMKNYISTLNMKTVTIYSVPDLYMRSSPVLNGTSSFDFLGFSQLLKVSSKNEKTQIINHLNSIMEIITNAQQEEKKIIEQKTLQGQQSSQQQQQYEQPSLERSMHTYNSSHMTSFYNQNSSFGSSKSRRLRSHKTLTESDDEDNQSEEDLPTNSDGSNEHNYSRQNETVVVKIPEVAGEVEEHSSDGGEQMQHQKQQQYQTEGFTTEYFDKRTEEAMQTITQVVETHLPTHVEAMNLLTNGTTVGLTHQESNDSYMNTKRQLINEEVSGQNNQNYRHSISMMLSARGGGESTQRGESTDYREILQVPAPPSVVNRMVKQVKEEDKNISLNQGQFQQDVHLIQSMPEKVSSVVPSSQQASAELLFSKKQSKMAAARAARILKKARKVVSVSSAFKLSKSMASNHAKEEGHIASSINSSKTSGFQKKKEIIRQIVIERQDRFTTSIKYIGFVLLAILVGVSAILYQQIMSAFELEISTFKDIPYAVSVRADYSMVILNKELEVVLTDDLFGFLSDTTTAAKVASMLTVITDDNLLRFNHYNEMFMQFYADTKMSGLKEFMLDSYLYIKVYREDGTYFTAHLPMSQTFQFVQEALYEYMTYGIDRESSYNNIQQNLVSLMDGYTKLQEAVVDESLVLLDDISNLTTISLSVIVCMSSAMIVILFPLFSKVQAKREEILKLNATFDPSKLEPLVNALQALMRKMQWQLQQKRNRSQISAGKIMNLTTQAKFFTDKSSDQGQSNARPNHKKKKMISSTTTLNRFNAPLILGGLFIGVLICVYPVGNIFIFNSFITEAKYSIQEMDTLYSARAQLTSNFAANYMAMSEAMKDAPMDSLKYERVQLLASSDEVRLREILAILNNFNDARYQDAEYNGFFLRIINANICTAIEKYPRYVQSDYEISQSDCLYGSSGVLTQGLYVSLQYVFNRFEEALPNFDKTSVAEFTTNMRKWVSTFDFFEFNQTYYDLVDVIENLRYFMVTVTDEYFTYIKQTTTYLFILCLVGLLFGFTLCWIKFFEFIRRSLRITRSTITAIKIGYVLENTYFMSFLSAELKK